MYIYDATLTYAILFSLSLRLTRPKLYAYSRDLEIDGMTSDEYTGRDFKAECNPMSICFVYFFFNSSTIKRAKS